VLALGTFPLSLAAAAAVKAVPPALPGSQEAPVRGVLGGIVAASRCVLIKETADRMDQTGVQQEQARVVLPELLNRQVTMEALVWFRERLACLRRRTAPHTAIRR